MWKSGELPELSRIPWGGTAYSNNYSSPCFRPVFPWVPDSTSIWIPSRHGKVSIACSDSSCLFLLLPHHQAVSPSVQHCGKGEQLTSSTDPKPWGSSLILLFLSYPTLNYQPITWAHNPFAYRISSAFQVFEFRSLFTTFVVTAGVQSAITSHLGVAWVSTLISPPPTLETSHLTSLVPMVYSYVWDGLLNP